jgi:hypothetical protein
MKSEDKTNGHDRSDQQMTDEAAISLRAGDILYGAVVQASRDIQNARDEFKRSVNPDELRSWILAQFKKHPQGGHIKEAVDDWPETFPQLPRRHFLMSLHPPKEIQGHNARLEARLRWGFFDQNLTVTVLLKPDGSPADAGDEEHLPPTQKWARGITFGHIHR